MNTYIHTYMRIYRATSSGTKVRIIVTLVPAEQGRLNCVTWTLTPTLVGLTQDRELFWLLLTKNAHVLILRREIGLDI